MKVGRGIFAAERIPAGTTIDTAPVIVLGADEFDEHVRHTSLLHYT